MQAQKVEQLPVFVYGSLRPGAKEHSRVRPFVDANGVMPARLEGLQMYNFGFYPGIVAAPGIENQVVGDLLIIKPQHWDECIEKLDSYESNSYLFLRSDKYYATIWRPASTTLVSWQEPKANSVRCWFYLVNTAVMVVERSALIKSNDWMNRG